MMMDYQSDFNFISFIAKDVELLKKIIYQLYFFFWEVFVYFIGSYPDY